MSEPVIITGRLHVTESLRNSTFGNPRYRAIVGARSVVTSPNSMIAYAINNYEGKEVRVTARMLRGRLSIVSIELVEEQSK